MKKDSTIEIGTLYDLNKQVISQLPEMSQENIQRELINIKEWFKRNQDEEWFMLLCREKADYTLFHLRQTKDVYNKTIKALEECVKNRGFLMGINFVKEQNAYEI